jgi:hypothetical protein
MEQINAPQIACQVNCCYLWVHHDGGGGGGDARIISAKFRTLIFYFMKETKSFYIPKNSEVEKKWRSLYYG